MPGPWQEVIDIPAACHPLSAVEAGPVLCPRLSCLGMAEDTYSDRHASLRRCAWRTFNKQPGGSPESWVPQLSHSNLPLATPAFQRFRQWRGRIAGQSAGCTITVMRAYVGVTDNDWYHFL